MKKLISLTLVLIMLFAVMAPVASAVTNDRVKYPIIFIAGSSVDLVDGDQNPISTGFDVLTDDDEGDLTKDDIIAKVMNVMIPFVVEGLPFDKWDNYGEALYEELAPIFEEGQLDGNGNPKFGTGVAKAEIDSWNHIASTKDYGSDGVFGLWDYKFRYDWRLSPYDSVDRLHTYIKTILNTTKCKKVCLVGRCLGGNLVTAYLDKYGSEGLVAKVVYDEVMSNGSATINDCFSGKIKFSDKHIQAYVAQTEYFANEDLGIDISSLNNILVEAIEQTIDFTTQTGIMDSIFGGVESLYERLYSALMPAFLLASGIATWPSYWTSIYEEDFDAALDLMFGKEGSEKRTEYAGLIEKILYLRERFTIPRERKGADNLYKQFEKNYGVEIAVLAGYGLVQAPITESYDLTGDCTVDLRSASFGATAAGVFDTLSDEYIAERVAAGYGDYISADKKVDASTCLFPDTTWFLKNKHHDGGSGWDYIATHFCQYKDYTVSNNYKDISRFVVIKSIHSTSSSGFENLTAENSADGEWLNIVEQEPTKESVFVAAMRWFTTLFKVIGMLLRGEISFGEAKEIL
jgi:hypothetical protein